MTEKVDWVSLELDNIKRVYSWELKSMWFNVTIIKKCIIKTNLNFIVIQKEEKSFASTRFQIFHHGWFYKFPFNPAVEGNTLSANLNNRHKLKNYQMPHLFGVTTAFADLFVYAITHNSTLRGCSTIIIKSDK